MILSYKMERDKITITLHCDIIKRIDETVDGEKIRNRSHAIEYLLRQSLKPKISKAYILAGGQGVKMKPFTEELPKPLLPIHGKPLLEYQIELLRSNEIREIYILIGHLGEKIQYYFGDGTRFGININYLSQPKAEIGTGHALYLARYIFTDAPFLTLYGDMLININLKDFIEHHLEGNTLATIALTSTKYPSPYGVAGLSGSKIANFTEKPAEKEAHSHVISAGLFCFNPKIFERFSSKKNFALERHVFPKLASEGQLGGYLFEGKWFDIGTPEIYAKAIREWG